MVWWEEAGGCPLALGLRTIRKICTAGRAYALSGAAWSPPCVGLGGAGPATAHCASAPPGPGAPPRSPGRSLQSGGAQRNGRGAVWLLVPRGRGPPWDVRPGHTDRPGECPRGVKTAGCPGAGLPGSTPCPGSPGAESCGSGRRERAYVGVLCVRAGVRLRAFWGVWMCVDVVCVCFYVPMLGVGVGLYACVCVCCVHFCAHRDFEGVYHLCVCASEAMCVCVSVCLYMCASCMHA